MSRAGPIRGPGGEVLVARFSGMGLRNLAPISRFELGWTGLLRARPTKWTGLDGLDWPALLPSLPKILYIDFYII